MQRSKHSYLHHDNNKSTVKNYFSLLSGTEDGYPEGTTKRVNQFGYEFLTKREYDKFTTFEAESDDMIIAQNLRLFSFCEHHLLPFFGIVNIGYVPDKMIFGLSKLQRIVDKFSSKPTLQERLTKEISTFINDLVNPKGVIVQVKGIHTCIVARGTQSTNAQYTTVNVTGIFKTIAEVRNEFYHTLESNHTLRVL